MLPAELFNVVNAGVNSSMSVVLVKVCVPETILIKHMNFCRILRPTLMQWVRSQAALPGSGRLGAALPSGGFPLKALPPVTQRRRGFPTLQGGR